MRLQDRLDTRVETLQFSQNFLLTAVEILDPLPRFLRRTLKGDHEYSMSVHRAGGLGLKSAD